MTTRPKAMTTAILEPAGRDDRAPGEAWQRAGNHPGSFYTEVIGGSALRRAPSYSPVPQANALVDQDVFGATPEIFRSVRPNIVQSIRAFRVLELAQAAESLGQHFLFANCAEAQTRAEVLETIGAAFLFPKPYAKSFDSLSGSLTDLLHKAGPQPGFVIVLEGLPCAPKFDKEARETLLDVFRDAADFWAERKIPFRVFYAFA